MNMQLMLDYLSDLEQHNDQQWFHDNHDRYKQATGEFEELVQALMLELKRVDETVFITEPKELTFKLMRDTRFSHDKSPYNPAFRAHISAKGKLPIPVGYYLMLRPGDRSFLGGGLFADMLKDATKRIRDAICTQGPRWEQILSDPQFHKRFTLGGTALKNVPKEYDPSHPQGQYLKYKSWYLEYPILDAAALKEDFVSFAVQTFSYMKPFNDFLNEALRDFEFPKR